MTGLLRGELLKARSMPATWGFLAAIAVMTALNTTLSLSDPETAVATDAGVRHVFTAGRDFAVLFIALGAVGAATEFRHGTAVTTFLITPGRPRVLAAKGVAFALIGLAVAVACAGLQMAIALPWVAEHGGSAGPLDAAVAGPVTAGVASATAYTALGVALGTLLRNQVVALAVVFGWFAVAENALATFLPDVSRFLPGGLFSGAGDTDLLGAPVAVALLAAYTVALAALAARTTLRQDV